VTGEFKTPDEIPVGHAEWPFIMTVPAFPEVTTHEEGLIEAPFVGP
jgi:hypothetical protein